MVQPVEVRARTADKRPFIFMSTASGGQPQPIGLVVKYRLCVVQLFPLIEVGTWHMENWLEAMNLSRVASKNTAIYTTVPVALQKA